MKGSRTVAAALTAAVLLAGGCSSSGKKAGDSSSGTTAPGSSTTAPVSRPAGPAATFAALTGGKGTALLAAVAGPKLEPGKWVVDEYSASGEAVRYTATGKLPADGRFDLTPGTSAAYKTRIVVQRPKAAADFNGTVVVEWLNVSGGFDASPDRTYLGNELVRQGYAWVGVSAQRIGVEGGAVAVKVPAADLAGAGKGLKGIDPARYGSLVHPGDAYSYDIFTQVARGLRLPGAAPLGGLKPAHVLAVGESQSAFMLTTYVDGVQPLTKEFDGFLIHSRGGAAAPLGEPGKGIDITGTIAGTPTRIRTDQTVPVITLETETDVAGILSYLPARQPDSDHFRLWEVAGTSHADTFLLGDVGKLLQCPTPINAGPHHFVAETALHDLNVWAAGGAAPPKAPRLEVDAKGKYVLDADGNVKGGIRTPLVDVPVDALSGVVADTSSVACVLFGSTLPIPPARLKALYPSRQAYLDRFTASADAAIKAGFVLPAERATLLAAAQPDRIPS